MSKLIYIPTLNRVETQKTLDWIPPVFKKITRLVVHPDEAVAHHRLGRKVLVCDAQGSGLHNVRQWIVDHARENGIDKAVMMDDDVKPGHRKPDGRILTPTNEEIEMAIHWLFDNLDDYVQTAWSERSVNWACMDTHAIASKGICCMGFDVHKLHELDVQFNKGIPDTGIAEDYHMILQLFSLGIPNILSYEFRYCASFANNPGGCQDYRTFEVMEKWAKLLESLYPDYVTAVKKTTKSASGGAERWDVRVQWKKAFKAGVEKRKLRGEN